MKNYSNILLSLGVTLFLLTLGMKNEAVSKLCSYGGTPVYDTLTVDGCDYVVLVCYTCRYALPGEAYIQDYFNLTECSTTLNPNEVFQGIMSQISNYAYLWFDHCQGNVPPCNGKERTEITFNIPICWQAICISNSPLKHLYQQCEDESECFVTYSYCKDLFNNVHKEVKEFYPSGTRTCVLEGHEILPLPTSLGDSTDCYIIHTPCNP